MGFGLGERGIRVLAVAATLLLAVAAVMSLPQDPTAADAPYVVPVQDAGTVILRQLAPNLEVASTNPTEGWQVDVVTGIGPVVTVQFQRDQRRLDMRAELSEGKVLVQIQERLSGSLIDQTVTELDEPETPDSTTTTTPTSSSLVATADSPTSDPTGQSTTTRAPTTSSTPPTTIASTTTTRPTTTTTTRPTTTTTRPTTTTTTRPTTTTTRPTTTTQLTTTTTRPTTTTTRPTTTTTTQPTTTTTQPTTTTTQPPTNDQTFAVGQVGTVQVLCVAGDVNTGNVTAEPGWQFAVRLNGPGRVLVEFWSIESGGEDDFVVEFIARANADCEIFTSVRVRTDG